MGFISEREVEEFWFDDNVSEVTSRLKKLYRAAERDGLSISKSYNPWVNEHPDAGLIECIRGNFDDSFVILRYDSWIFQFLLDKQYSQDDLGSLYLHFWKERTRKNESEQHGELGWDYKNADKTRMEYARIFSDGTDPQGRIQDYDFSKRHELIAAFSESKIYIGWQDIDPRQLAGIVHDRNPATPTPCFSWSEKLELENPGTNCLFPWEKFTSASTPKYKPEQSIALFNELFVNCTTSLLVNGKQYTRKKIPTF